MTTEGNGEHRISKKKIFYPINEELMAYLQVYDRTFESPLQYEDLLRYTDHYPILDSNGKDTLWEGVMYSYHEHDEIHEGLKKIYQRLRSDGNDEATEHLIVDSIDFCSFGNSYPFRIKIKNQHNDNHDYFYVKKADASRIYGLELEYMLSPNRIYFLVDKNTLIEEHISGIPGDVFLERYMDENQNKIRLAKEFVKFNERCFLRLLGDMRSYNFVIVLTPDFDQMQYRIRSIDFDQQSYEGRMNLYKPQFFRENLEYVKFVTENLDPSSIKQYQNEERALIARRMIIDKKRLTRLMKIMKGDMLAPKEKTENLKQELYLELKDENFIQSKSMGDLVENVLNSVLKDYLHNISEKPYRKP